MSETTFRRIWHESYPPGMCTTLEPYREHSVYGLLDNAARLVATPSRWLLLLTMLLGLLLAAGCGGDVNTESINTGSLTSEDLPRLLPDADTAESVLGVTVDQVDERSDLSQSFEHTDAEDLEGAHLGSYRVASESGGQIPTGSASIQLALYETSDAAEAAMEVVTGEAELDPDSVRSEFDVTDLADASQGFAFSGFTWTMLRWDSLLTEVVVFHPPDTDLNEEARRLAEEVRTNLSTIDDG